MTGPGTSSRVLHGRRSRIVWAAVVVEVIAMAAAWIAIPPDGIPVPAILAFFLIVVPSGVMGALIANRQPHNAIGWILVGLAAFLAITTVQLFYVMASWNQSAGAWPGTVVLAWIGSWTLPPVVVVMTLLLPLLFPDGRLPSPRWRPALWALGTVTAVLAIPAALQPGPLGSFDFIRNPVGVDGIEPVLTVLFVLAPILYGVALITVLAGARSRYRRGTQIERLQLRWFGASLVVIGLLVSMVMLPLSEAGWIIALVGLSLIPVAIGVAVLRYRLYEIDRIISRTLGWAIVSAILGAVFVAAVIGLQALLAPFTENNTVAVAASTLVAAALFQPLRARVQRRVDRRFNRSRVDAELAVAGFATHARDEVDLGQLRDTVLKTTRLAVAPVAVKLWLRSGR